jgi:hypothetical protein
VPRKLTDAEIAAAGVSFPCEEMDTGQRRFRLNTPDGAGYLVIYASPTPQWDNSHSHHIVREIVHIVRGEVVFAFLKDGRATLHHFKEGDHLTLEPTPPHNLLMGTGAILQVMKIAMDPSIQPDWIPSPELDKLTKHLDPKDVFGS